LAIVGTSFDLVHSARAELPRNALWQIVDGLCVPAQRTAALPLPCLQIDLQQGFAVLAVAAAHLLVVPIDPEAGRRQPPSPLIVVF
jgi:CDP-diacylglycerol pyrophosphatase